MLISNLFADLFLHNITLYCVRYALRVDLQKVFLALIHIKTQLDEKLLSPFHSEPRYSKSAAQDEFHFSFIYGISTISC